MRINKDKLLKRIGEQSDTIAQYERILQEKYRIIKWLTKKLLVTCEKARCLQEEKNNLIWQLNSLINYQLDNKTLEENKKKIKQSLKQRWWYEDPDNWMLAYQFRDR